MNEPFVSVLHQEHEDVMYLANQINNTSGSDMTKTTDLWNQLKSKLIPHLIAEETVFYPAIKAKSELVKYGDEAHNQHREIESGIFEVNSLPVQDSSGWMSTFNDFKMKLQNHIRYEETVVFDVEQTYFRGEGQNLLNKFRKAEDEAKSVTISGRYEGGFLPE
jgi:iron-sulfur cluster repair protein YtfE (RIC family)